MYLQSFPLTKIEIKRNLADSIIRNRCLYWRAFVRYATNNKNCGFGFKCYPRWNETHVRGRIALHCSGNHFIDRFQWFNHIEWTKVMSLKCSHEIVKKYLLNDVHASPNLFELMPLINGFIKRVVVVFAGKMGWQSGLIDWSKLVWLKLQIYLRISIFPAFEL